jgi:hypothetical protein
VLRRCGMSRAVQAAGELLVVTPFARHIRAPGSRGCTLHREEPAYCRKKRRHLSLALTGHKTAKRRNRLLVLNSDVISFIAVTDVYNRDEKIAATEWFCDYQARCHRLWILLVRPQVLGSAVAYLGCERRLRAGRPFYKGLSKRLQYTERTAVVVGMSGRPQRCPSRQVGGADQLPKWPLRPTV